MSTVRRDGKSGGRPGTLIPLFLTEKPLPKTLVPAGHVEVRIPVGVSPQGDWCGLGSSADRGLDDTDAASIQSLLDDGHVDVGAALYMFTAVVPLPEPTAIETPAGVIVAESEIFQALRRFGAAYGELDYDDRDELERKFSPKFIEAVAEVANLADFLPTKESGGEEDEEDAAA